MKKLIFTLTAGVLFFTSAFAWSSISRTEIVQYAKKINVYFLDTCAHDWPDHFTINGVYYYAKKLELDTINYFRGNEILWASGYSDTLAATNKCGFVWQWFDNDNYICDDALYMSIWDHSCDPVLNPSGGVFFNIEYQKMDMCSNFHLFIFDTTSVFQQWTDPTYGRQPIWYGWKLRTPKDTFYIEKWGSDQYFFTRDSVAQGGAQIKLTLRKCRDVWDYWDVNYPSLRKDLTVPLNLKYRRNRTLSWIQNDKARALILELLIKNVNNDTCWIRYCPSEWEYHYLDTASHFVAMADTNDFFNMDKEYFRSDVIKDIKLTVPTFDTIGTTLKVCAMRVSHFTNSGLSWESMIGQDCGGVIKFISFGDIAKDFDLKGQEYIEDKIISIVPNPFYSDINISFQTKKNNNIKVNIYNIVGQHVKTLVNEPLNPGVHNVIWDGKSDNKQLMPSGSYFVKIIIGEKEYNQSIRLIR